MKLSWSSFDEYLKEEEKDDLGANTAHLVGHGAIRSASLGNDARAPTGEELQLMRDYTREAIQSGAYNLSTGLIYPPSIYAETNERIELAKVGVGYCGIYNSHIRGEGRTLMKALNEAIEVGEEDGIPVARAGKTLRKPVY